MVFQCKTVIRDSRHIWNSPKTAKKNRRTNNRHHNHEETDTVTKKSVTSQKSPTIETIQNKTSTGGAQEVSPNKCCDKEQTRNRSARPVGAHHWSVWVLGRNKQLEMRLTLPLQTVGVQHGAELKEVVPSQEQHNIIAHDNDFVSRAQHPR